MKNTLLLLAFAALSFFAHSCDRDKKPPPTPPVTSVVVPDSQYCHTIAPIQKTDRAVAMTGKLWPNGKAFKVRFIGSATSQQRAFFTNAINEWAKVVNLEFVYISTGESDLRISFVTGSGSWSYIGTDAAKIPQNQATMNIGWLGEDVCLHEIGHAIGMGHEQGSPNSTICWNTAVVYAALGGPPNNWTKAMVDYNVFRKLTPVEATATRFDPLSIMQYSIPGGWLCPPSIGIAGGKVLSELDKSFMAEKYPRPPSPTGVTITREKAKDLVKEYEARLLEFDVVRLKLKETNEATKKAFGL